MVITCVHWVRDGVMVVTNVTVEKDKVVATLVVEAVVPATL
jgi:hypothetical protein